MKMLEKRPSMRKVTEHIEMKLLASEEPCTVVLVQDTEEDYCSYYKHLEHPLVSDAEEEYPVPHVQTPPQQHFNLKRVLSVGTEDFDDCHLAPDLNEDMEIELEEFPPFNTSQSDRVVKTSGVPPFRTPRFFSVGSLNQVTCVRWRRAVQQSTGLVVKDVLCLPRGHLLAHPDRHGAPRGQGRAALAAVGMTARIAIDCGWSASQMESRLCVQGSRALFVPDPPVEGWTGEQVLQICGHGPLYILSHHDYTQAESDWSERWTQAGVQRKGVSVGSCDETQQGGVDLPPDHSHKDDLDSVLRRFRRRAGQPSHQLLVSLSWGKPLLSALRMLSSPGFSYRATPVVPSRDAQPQPDRHQRDLREFFRLALLELQHSSVFEGPPGRLFLTHDLTALEDRKYYKAGVLIGWSLAHGGPGPQCIHPAFYQLMCGQNAFLDDFDWRDVTNPEAQVRLKGLHSPARMELLSDSPYDRDERSGLPQNHSVDLSSSYARLVNHYIYHRVASMAAQFTDGLDSCDGLWETVRAHWEAFAPVMTSMVQKT